MSDRYNSVWLVFYNENPAEEGDSFLGAFIRRYEMSDYLKANFKPKDMDALKVFKMTTRHWYASNKESYWKTWHNDLSRFEYVDISDLFGADSE